MFTITYRHKSGVIATRTVPYFMAYSQAEWIIRTGMIVLLIAPAD